MKKLFTIVVFLALLGGAYFVGQQMERKNMQMQLDQLQEGNAQRSQEEAKRIVSKVRKHIVIAGETEPTVATIVDVDTLKSRNSFYAQAKNGDHLVVTTNRAILYDPDADIILDVVPIQLESNAPAPPAQEPAAAGENQ